MLSSNTKLHDRYRIIRHLGQGGMGTVYEAIDENVNCIVVVKEFVRGDAGAFKREAELLANLRHPLLPHVTDHFSVNEGSFLVMQFIPGNDLAEMLELRGSPFPVEQVLGWADALLKVLEYLHGQKVLHRDIKPSNLKVLQTGEIFLLDFGLAKGAVGQMSTLKTNHSVVGYTLAYASLEQIHEHGTDARSDLYSLGATLYHLLTGVLPIDAPTRDLTIDDEDPDPLRPVHELNPQVAPAISAVIQQAMAPRRRERPESAAEMRRLLSEASRTAPPSPIPPILLPINGRNGSKSKLLSVTTIFLSVVGAVVLGLIFKMSGTTANDVVQNNPSGNINVNTSKATPTPLPRKVKNRIGMEFVLVPAGSFMMGSSDADVQRGFEQMQHDYGKANLKWFMAEIPQHQVTIREGFYMGQYEVTQAQWQQVMGSNPSNFKGCDQCPVEQVSWNDSQEFIRKLNAQNDGYVYRLPSEAEWEYACRAGTTGDYAGSFDEMGWHIKNSDYKTHPVGQKQPNAFGLYDMHGNVVEWCEDVWRNNYDNAPTDGSAWLGEITSSSNRVLRGGSWSNYAFLMRSASRGRGTSDLRRNDSLGFRLVAVARM